MKNYKEHSSYTVCMYIIHIKSVLSTIKHNKMNFEILETVIDDFKDVLIVGDLGTPFSSPVSRLRLNKFVVVVLCYSFSSLYGQTYP